MKIIFKLAGIFLIVSTISAQLFAGSYIINKEKSEVNWIGKKVAGEHVGTIKFNKGSLEVVENRITSGSVEIDMGSIVNTDLGDEAWNQKLIGHLKSDDFFSVEKHPVSVLVLNKVTHISGNEYTFEGNLTITGIIHPVSYVSTVNMMGNKLIAVGSIEVDRTLYEIKYGSGKFFSGLGDKMINDYFTLNFKLEAEQLE